MRSLCLFASYFPAHDLPYYIVIYLKELKKHFTEVILLTSQKKLSPSSVKLLKAEQISYYVEDNEGYDFGLWYKAFLKTEVQAYEQVALVNDSCILFRPLDHFMDWSRSEGSDMQGMTYSEAIAPHLQSYFLVINKNAIEPVRQFFIEHKIIPDISEVIRTYEVGLSAYLLKRGLKIAAYMSSHSPESEFSPYYSQVKEQIIRGIPLIKKKIIFSSYRKDEMPTLARMNFDVNVNTYVQLIEQQGTPLILSFDDLLASENNKMKGVDRMKYALLRVLIQLYRKIKYGR